MTKQPTTPGEAIRAYLDRQGLSQTAAAAKAGMSLSRLNDLVCDRRSPRVASLQALAAGLGCELADLLPPSGRPASRRRAGGRGR